MSQDKSCTFFLALLLSSIAIATMFSSHWGAEARYLPTRSDPLAPVGPPHGEDARFDRIYDIIKELLAKNGGLEPTDEIKYSSKNHYDGDRY